jgi:ribonuclease BN (tRNA processing enzyme)
MAADGTGLLLDVLGAGPAYTDRLGSAGAAYLVRSGDTSVVLDLGQGAFPRLATLVEPSSVDAIFVSHLHPDHFIDLIALRHYLRWQFHPPRRVRVVAADGLVDRLDALHDEPGFTAASLAVAPLAEGTTTVDGIAVDALRVTHTGDSFAFRVTAGDGPGLVYSGDCGRAADLEPLIRAGDTVLCEVSFGPGPVPANAAHLDGPAVGELAAQTSPGRVLLTHLQMGFDPVTTIAAVRRAYGGPVDLVEPGDRFTIGG